MVKVREDLPQKQDGTVDIDQWVSRVAAYLPEKRRECFRQAVLLSFEYGALIQSPYQASCFHMGLMTAEILRVLEPDADTLSAAVLCFTLQYTPLLPVLVGQKVGHKTEKLAQGLLTLKATHAVTNLDQAWDIQQQRDNLRRMLLALVEDVRVVLIKLAEQLCILRQSAHLEETVRLKIAQQTRDIYAPLANRLGIGQIKWELEDFAFRYLEPVAYKHIAKLLAEKRIDRDAYIVQVVAQITDALAEQGIHAEVTGRAKHIYSIWRKMKNKGVDFQDIYDVRAVRILVPEVKDCYAALGVVHSFWQHIPKEFDDYIATPKENGYRSLHTAVIGPQGRTLEIQIRTVQMHQESELGVAAHWMYKEGASQDKAYQNKLASLRQILEWQDELNEDEPLRNYTAEFFDDCIYVFSPRGDVIDLPQKSTPLDFAYHIHSEIGHRCRGAKINGKIVPLTYCLRSGDQVEILTAKEAHPSRDWLNPHLNYCRSSRAKAKIHAWFRHQDKEKHKQLGRELLERETKRLGLGILDLEAIAAKLNKPAVEDLWTALGAGDIRLTQVFNAQQRLQQDVPKINIEPIQASDPKRFYKSGGGISIAGIGNLLCNFAKCCKPLPGDNVVGYITQGRGVSIHRQDCNNITQAERKHDGRIVPVQWDSHAQSVYPVDIGILAEDRQGLLNDIFSILAKEQVNIIRANTKTNKDLQVNMQLTLEITDLNILDRVLSKILQLPNIQEAYRIKV